MEWSEIWKIILCAVGSAGGVGAIIVCAVKFASDIIAERLSQKYEARLQKELEQYRATLDSKRYISQVRFDKEFEMYQDLSEKNLKMVYDIGQAVKIVRGLYQNNDDIINHDQHLVDSLNDAEFTTKRYAAFIDERLYSKYHELQKKAQIVFKLFDFWCMNENAIFVFRNERYTRESAKAAIEKMQIEVSDLSDSIIKDIRVYLNSLDAMEER